MSLPVTHSGRISTRPVYRGHLLPKGMPPQSQRPIPKLFGLASNQQRRARFVWLQHDLLQSQTDTKACRSISIRLAHQRKLSSLHKLHIPGTGLQQRLALQPHLLHCQRMQRHHVLVPLPVLCPLLHHLHFLLQTLQATVDSAQRVINSWSAIKHVFHVIHCTYFLLSLLFIYLLIYFAHSIKIEKSNVKFNNKKSKKF